VKWSDGDIQKYTVQELKNKIQKGEEAKKKQAQEKAAREKRAAQEKADRAKSHSGTYLDRSYGDHQGRWERISYGSHSGEWKTRWTKSNSWTCCEGKNKTDLLCSENPIYNWSCCRSDAKNNNKCQKNPLGMKWTCCGDQDQTNLVCRLYSEMDHLKAAGCDCNVTQNGLVIVSFRVKPGLNSLSNALKIAKENGIKEIKLLNGVHDEKGEYVVIDFPLTIVGESKDGCTIIGGLKMEGKKEDDVTVKHLTISQSKEYGVYGVRGMSFHLFNLNIEKSEGSGVNVIETKRNTMSNCQVSHSRWSGVQVNGLITMNGSGTSIHNNVTGGTSYNYGLCTPSWNSSSSIHLVSPLTKESVSINNGGGRNCGGSGTIKTI
jgi:hypothetical protein